MYRRRYSRSYSRVKRAKYSNETHAMGVDLDEGETANIAKYNAGQLAMLMIPASKNQGMRKAKNFDLALQSDGMGNPVHFALVYVPEGQDPSTMQRPPAYAPPTAEGPAAPNSIYEPNQNVIISGVLPPSASSVIHFRTRLARNLNSGDAIYLCMEPSLEQNSYGKVVAQLNYAICY